MPSPKNQDKTDIAKRLAHVRFRKRTCSGGLVGPLRPQAASRFSAEARRATVHQLQDATEPAERPKAAIDAMRTHSRDFEERIRAAKCEEQKDPLEMSDRQAPRRLRNLAGRLLQLARNLPVRDNLDQRDHHRLIQAFPTLT